MQFWRWPLLALAGLAVIMAYLVLAVFAPLIAPWGETQVVAAPFEPWGGAYLLGTDNLGRDMLSRLIFGARNTIGLAMMIMALAFAIGGALGLVSATVSGWVDQLLGRCVDILMAIPQLIFALLLLTILGNSIPVLVLVIATLEGTRVFRVVRATAQSILVLDYIESARLGGEGLWAIAFKEVLPNALPPLMIEFGLRFCFTLLFISSLSFLGLGLQAPAASWGSMVRDNATLISYGDATPLLPAFAIGLLAVSINLVVDWALNAVTRVQT